MKSHLIPNGTPVTLSCLVDGQCIWFSTNWDWALTHAVERPLTEGILRLQITGGYPTAGTTTIRIWAPTPKSNGGAYLAVAAKLELGPTQTLAHKEGDAWVLNDPPPIFQQEWEKCARYQIVLKNTFISGMSNATGTILGVILELPTCLRIKPAITADVNWIRGIGESIPIENVNLGVYNLTGNRLEITVTQNKTLTPMQMYAMSVNAMILDANL